MAKSRREWLDEVVGHIRFAPDRKAVFEELTAHIQDRSDDLVSRGYTREEADDRTLLAMGDPVEVGKQLDAVHKPWLGRLWMVSKVLVIITLVLSLFLVWPTVRRYRDAVESDANERNTVEYWVQGFSPVSRHTMGKTMEIDGYRFTVDEVSWWRDEEETRLIVCVTVQSPFFQPKPDQYNGYDVGIEAFYIVDDRGNRVAEWDDEVPALPRKVLSHYDPSKVGRPRTGSCIYAYDATDWNPEWVEFSFDFEGRTYSVRFPGPGGEGA